MRLTAQWIEAQVHWLFTEFRWCSKSRNDKIFRMNIEAANNRNITAENTS